MKMEMRNESGSNHSFTSQKFPAPHPLLPKEKSTEGVMPSPPRLPLGTAESGVGPRDAPKERLQIDTGQATSVPLLQANGNCLFRGNQESRYLGITWLQIPN